MFDKKLFLSHHTNRQNMSQGSNFDRVVVDSQGMRWGFDARKGIYENLNTGQRMNSVLFENTNLSNAAAAAGDASSGWGVSNRSSDVNTPEAQARLTQKGSSRSKSFRQAENSLVGQISIISEQFLPTDAIFYGRIQGPYFDDLEQTQNTIQWRTSGEKNKVYFNPYALSGATGPSFDTEFTSIDSPGLGHIEVESFKTVAINGAGGKVGFEIVFGNTSDAKNASDIIWGTTSEPGFYYTDAEVYSPQTTWESHKGDRNGRAVFYSRLQTSGKTLAMMGSQANTGFTADIKFGFRLGRNRTSAPGGAYASSWRQQMHDSAYGGGWFGYDDWVAAGQTGGTAEFLSRTVFIALGAGIGVWNAPNASGHMPLGNAFQKMINNGATGYSNLESVPAENIPSENNFHHYWFNNPNGVGSTATFSIDFAFLKGQAGSTTGLISDWSSFYGSTGNTAYA